MKYLGIKEVKDTVETKTLLKEIKEDINNTSRVHRLEDVMLKCQYYSKRQQS